MPIDPLLMIKKPIFEIYEKNLPGNLGFINWLQL